MGNKITRRCSNVDERFTRLQGLYPQHDVDQKKLRRLILDSKLAPCFPGEDELNADSEECPICFLCYPSLNRSKCCSKGVCTECYLQMKSPRATRATQCPFCKSHNYTVEFRGVKSQEERIIEAAEEQKVIEAKIRMRKQEILDDEEREQRQKENHRQEIGPDLTPGTPVDELGVSSPVSELPESCSIHVNLIETPQQELATVLSNNSCDDLDSSRVQEESGSEESTIAAAPQQSTLSPLPTSSEPVESATSQHLSRPAQSVYARHRADDLDFDLEDIMIMEAIWQSLQKQGTYHRCSSSEPVLTASIQAVSEFGVGADIASVSQAQSPPAGREYQHPRATGSVTGGLATAIAALAERHAIKGEHVYEALQRASAGQAEVGTSSCAVPVLGRLPKPVTDKPGEVMLPQTFEEQMMLAMALSITDAQARARLEDSHPRPLPNVS